MIGTPKLLRFKSAWTGSGLTIESPTFYVVWQAELVRGRLCNYTLWCVSIWNVMSLLSSVNISFCKASCPFWKILTITACFTPSHVDTRIAFEYKPYACIRLEPTNQDLNLSCRKMTSVFPHTHSMHFLITCVPCPFIAKSLPQITRFLFRGAVISANAVFTNMPLITFLHFLCISNSVGLFIEESWSMPSSSRLLLVSQVSHTCMMYDTPHLRLWFD